MHQLNVHTVGGVMAPGETIMLIVPESAELIVEARVRPEDIDDLASSRLARDVVKKIEEQLQYPGQIKVTVIRETRAVDYAR